MTETDSFLSHNHNNSALPTRNPVKRLYNWVIHWAATPYGVLALFIISFVESSFFPVPPDILLIALCVAVPRKWAWFAVVCTLASITGGLAGYGIGFFLSDSVGNFLLNWIGVLTVHGGSEMASSFINHADIIDNLSSSNPRFALLADELRRVGELLSSSKDYLLSASDKGMWLRGEALGWYNGPWGTWAVAISGFTPIPYKVFTITAGVFEMNVAAFLIASAIGRGARFFLISALIGLTYHLYGDKLPQFIDRYFNWLAIAFVILLVGGFLFLKLL